MLLRPFVSRRRSCIKIGKHFRPPTILTLFHLTSTIYLVAVHDIRLRDAAIQITAHCVSNSSLTTSVALKKTDCIPLISDDSNDSIVVFSLECWPMKRSIAAKVVFHVSSSGYSIGKINLNSNEWRWNSFRSTDFSVANDSVRVSVCARAHCAVDVH